MLYSFRLYYIQFKEVKILWGPRAEYEGQGPGAGWTKDPFYYIVIQWNCEILIDYVNNNITRSSQNSIFESSRG